MKLTTISAASAVLMTAATWLLSVTTLLAATSTSLSYSTTFSDPSGTQQAVSFTGTEAGNSLTGTLTLNGTANQVTATVAPDGSVSGKLLNADGSQYGVFWAQRSGSLLKGSFDLNGKVGDWSVPANKLPIPK